MLSRSGLAVDSSGGAVVDPTKNVLDLVQALKEMLTAIRGADKEQADLRFRAAEQLNELRYKNTQDLAAALANKLSDEAKLRADFSDRLALAESKRIDAIRAVDVGAVAVANERTTAAATALAKSGGDSALVLSTQLTKSADDVRILLKTTADEQNRNLQQQFAGIITSITTIGTRVTTLEQALAEGVGRSKFQDPNVERMNRLVEQLVQSQSVKTGASEGQSNLLFGAITVISILIALATFFMTRFQPRQVRGRSR